MTKEFMLVENREVTEDALFDGSLKCLQYTDGYRFSIDAVLAAHFLKPSKGSRILDLGTGCGIISLILMYRWQERILSMHGLEIQPQLKILAEKNISLNGFSDNCSVIEGSVVDALKIFEPESFTQVVCNPPFYTVSSGRQNSEEQSRIARHQVSAGISDFAKGSSALVRNGGSVVLIYPADQIADLFSALALSRLTIKRIQLVYSYPAKDQEARLILVECRKNGGSGARVLEPFFIYKYKNGDYTDEMQKLYAS